MFLFGSKGSIELQLEKTIFKPGEEITGKLILKTNKPIKARELRILFYGLKTMQVRTIRDGKSVEETHTIRIAETKVVLGTEKEYTYEEHEFKIKIPENLPSIITPSLGGIQLGPVYLGRGYDFYTVEFLLDASLDIPAGFDINKKQKIYIEGIPGQV